MEFLRTPDHCFEALPDWPYAPHYLQVDDFEGGTLRLAYYDEGPKGGRPLLLLHGEPDWAYLYRKMIPGLVAAGHRVLAPDLIGMGRSDKPTRKQDYTYLRHIRWMQAWLAHMDTAPMVYFGQDWGSLIGLALVTQHPDRFAACVLANGMLPDMENLPRIIPFYMKSINPQAFGDWQNWIKTQTSIDCGAILAEGVPGVSARNMVIPLTAAERAAYNAPFPDASYQAGVLAFPFLADSMCDEARAICTQGWQVLEAWEKPFITAFGKSDPILGWADELFHHYIPGCWGRNHRVFPDGTHFIQEEEPAALVEVICEAVALS